MDDEYDVVGGYIPSFVQHLKDTGARLGLQVGSQVNEDRINAGGAVEEAAEAHALSSWTPAERDAFFRALSVHSRWRPDLIATCVPTRTEWEVWMYLEALEEGAATLAVQRGGEDVDMEGGFGDEQRDVGKQDDRSSSNSRSHSGSDTDEDEDEDLCEPAFEVSQAWIDVEERAASWIVHEEHLAYVESDVATADTEAMSDEPPKRKRGRPRSVGKGRAQSRVREQTVSNEGCHSSPSVHCSPLPESTSTPARKREMLMNRLEIRHLLVLDSILREGEEAMKKSKSREGSVTATTPTEHRDQWVPRVRDTEVSSSSHEIPALQGTSSVSQPPSDVVIDPVLLAISGGADLLERSGRVPMESTSTGCVPAHIPIQGPSLLPDASPQAGAGAMFTSRPDNATLTNPDPTANDGSDLSLLSPRSRRRMQKRLYMRRKRASLHENGTTSKDAVYTGIERLKPGKKANLERNGIQIVPTSVPCSEPPSDAETNLPENVSKRSKAGLTFPYKLKAEFAALGIDAAYLRDQGMDSLNLSALGRLMGLCLSLEHGEEADKSEIAQFIDAQLIRHLQAAMVTFVTDIVHRAIVWREREIRLKQRSQAWRHGDQITIGAVEHAVDAIGARYHSHKEYFKALGALHGLETESSSVPANASEEPIDGAVDPDVEAADRSAEPPGLSPHRDVYMPLIQPPSAWRMGPLTCLTRTYEREATRTRRETSAEIEMDELMSDETDEERLEGELNEEDEVDAWDMELAATHEEGLWDAVRRGTS